MSFYAVYKLLMGNDTWFGLRRATLLITLLLSIVLPLCVITVHHESTILYTSSIGSENDSSSLPSTPVFNETIIGYFTRYTSLLLLTGIAVMSVRFIVGLTGLIKTILSTEKISNNKVKICLTDKQIRPFSFFNYIVISRSDYESKEQAFLLHESSHISLHHTFDLVVIELFTIIQWWNPAVWLLRKEMRLVHEYEADDKVIHSEIGNRHYMNLLLTKSVSGKSFSIVNTFNAKHTLKRRFEAMAHKRSSSLCKLKTLYLFPIIIISLILFSKEKITYRYIYNPLSSVTPDFTYNKISGTTGTGFDLYYPIRSENTIQSNLENSIQGIQRSSDQIYYASQSKISGQNDEIKAVNIIEDSEELSKISKYDQNNNTYIVALEDTVLKPINDKEMLLTSSKSTSYEISPKRNEDQSRSQSNNLHYFASSNMLDATTSRHSGRISIELLVSDNHSIININAYNVQINGKDSVVIHPKTKLVQQDELSDQISSEDLSQTYKQSRRIIVVG